MFQLLVLLFIIKLYARSNIFLFIIIQKDLYLQILFYFMDYLLTDKYTEEHSFLQVSVI